MIYKCRARNLKWEDIEADSFSSAANDYHDNHKHLGKSIYRINGKNESASFLLVEVKEFGVFISRMFYNGIMRSGGISSKSLTERLNEIAKEFRCFEEDPKKLISDDDWDGVEKDYTF